MFTKSELFLFWVPGMVISAGVFSLLVLNQVVDLPTAALLVVIVGVLLRVAARKVNPRPVEKVESDVE